MHGYKLLAHGLRSLREQLDEEMPRKLGPRADAGGKAVVPIGTLDKLRETEFRKSGSAISSGAQRDLLVPTFDQHVGDLLAQRLSPRDREQVVRAHFHRVFDQGRIVETLGLREHR